MVRLYSFIRQLYGRIQVMTIAVHTYMFVAQPLNSPRLPFAEASAYEASIMAIAYCGKGAGGHKIALRCGQDTTGDSARLIVTLTCRPD